MASSSVRDVFLTPPEENNFNILQNTSDRNRKRNASIASDSGYFSEDSHGHVKISRTITLPVEPLPGELLPVEPLPENIWNAGVGYSPCQSPKLDLEELIQCEEEENGDIRNEEHSEDISVIHENSPLGLPEDPLSGIFKKGRFREMDKPDAAGNIGVDRHLRIEKDALIQLELLGNYQGKVAAILVRRVEQHKLEPIQMDGKIAFDAFVGQRKDSTIYKTLKLLNLQGDPLHTEGFHAAIFDYEKENQINLIFKLLSKSKCSSEAQRKWKLLIVPLHEENTSLEYISYKELELRYEMNLQIVAGGDEKRCKIEKSKSHPEWLPDFCKVKEKSIYKKLQDKFWQELQNVKNGVGLITEENLKKINGRPILPLVLDSITTSE